MKLYKLTDENNYSGLQYKKLKWKEGTTHSVKTKNYKNANLCSKHFIYAYKDPYIALVMNPVHAEFENPIIWEAEGKIIKSDTFQVGVRKLITIKKINISITLNQRIAFGILCAKEVCNDKKWNNLVDKWLYGTEWSYNSAYNYYVSFYNGSYFSSDHASFAAYAASTAAYAAAYAATYPADYNSSAAYSSAASAAIYASVLESNNKIDFTQLIHKAISIK